MLTEPCVKHGLKCPKFPYIELRDADFGVHDWLTNDEHQVQHKNRREERLDHAKTTWMSLLVTRMEQKMWALFSQHASHIIM